MASIADRRTLEELESDVRSLRTALLTAESARRDEIEAVHPAHRRSAANLVHYLELRRHDVRDLQRRLGGLGLSSLGRAESHVLATVEAVLAVLARLLDCEIDAPAATIGLEEGPQLLRVNADRLLGAEPPRRSTRMMVTLPGESARRPDLISDLVAHGMDLARINCAHDDEAFWLEMANQVRAAAAELGVSCLVAMDLGGPKLRTGPLQAGPRVVKVSPKRNALGQVVVAALVRLSATDDGSAESATGTGRKPAVTTVPVDDAAWLRRRRVGDRIVLRDARGSNRTWEVVEVDWTGVVVSLTQSTYISTGTRLIARRGGDDDITRVGLLPIIEQAHRIVRGDTIVLTTSLEPAPVASAGEVHRIGCTLPEAFQHAQPGERVWLDDGKIGGHITGVVDGEIELIVTDAPPGGANLRAEKGINLPDTDLRMAALTDRDLIDVQFVAKHADLVNLSFVREPSDVRQLRDELTRLGAPDLGIVLKIENATAFANLPELLLAAMHHEKVGIMIARGDLAVEVGYERLAEVQEQVMWVSEAAHVPVIWATQVLDTLARTGRASRAEVTDAAMSVRAECVMLNKGPYITDAMLTLDSILGRMQEHHNKKHSLLRRLRAWDHDQD